MRAHARMCQSILIPRSSQPALNHFFYYQGKILMRNIPEAPIASKTLANDLDSVHILSKAEVCFPTCHIRISSSRNNRPTFHVGLAEAFLCAVEDVTYGTRRKDSNNVRPQFLSLTIDSSQSFHPPQRQYQANSSEKVVAPALFY